MVEHLMTTMSTAQSASSPIKVSLLSFLPNGVDRLGQPPYLFTNAQVSVTVASSTPPETIPAGLFRTTCEATDTTGCGALTADANGCRLGLAAEANGCRVGLAADANGCRGALTADGFFLHLRAGPAITAIGGV